MLILANRCNKSKLEEKTRKFTFVEFLLKPEGKITRIQYILGWIPTIVYFIMGFFITITITINGMIIGEEIRPGFITGMIVLLILLISIYSIICLSIKRLQSIGFP